MRKAYRRARIFRTLKAKSIMETKISTDSKSKDAAKETASKFASDIQTIEKKLKVGGRIDRAEATWLWHNASDEEMSRLSKIVRARYHKPDDATYLLMRIINYTNVCVARCDYCSFYRLPKDKDGYVRSNEYVFSKIDELVAVGGNFFGFNGGFNPKLKIDYYVDLFSSIRKRYGDSIEFYALTVVEFLYIARLCKLSNQDALKMLKEAGVNWITGGGAEVLDDGFRLRHSPLKYTVKEYMDTQRDILDAGLKTTGTMVIGFDETFEERMNHLETVRDFQDERLNAGKQALFSFLAWTYKPYNNELGGEEISSQEYLRHLALSRIYLDNIKFIRTSVLTQNESALNGLNYGANDFDIPWEDEVTQMAGAVIEKDVERILGYANEVGFAPRLREVNLKD